MSLESGLLGASTSSRYGFSARSPRASIGLCRHFSTIRIALGCGVLAALAAARFATAQTQDGFIPMVTDSAAVIAEPATPKPDYLAPVTDPVFGTRLVRIAGDPGAPIAADGLSGAWAAGARPLFYTDQPWN